MNEARAIPSLRARAAHLLRRKLRLAGLMARNAAAVDRVMARLERAENADRDERMAERRLAAEMMRAEADKETTKRAKAKAAANIRRLLEEAA